MDSGGSEVRYVYDDLNQLIREDNGYYGYTYIYAYDKSGNLLTKTRYSLTAANQTPSGTGTVTSYTYGNSSWGDQLTNDFLIGPLGAGVGEGITLIFG